MGLVAERWTDDRMDDLKVQVEGIDRRMEQGFLEVRKEIGGLRSDLERQIGGLRSDLGGQIGGLRSDMERQMGGLRGETNGLRSQIGGLRSDMERQMHGLRDHMDKRLDAVLYALIGLSASMFAAMLGLIAAVILSL
jgi:hypothetical protein